MWPTQILTEVSNLIITMTNVTKSSKCGLFDKEISHGRFECDAEKDVCQLTCQAPVEKYLDLPIVKV